VLVVTPTDEFSELRERGTALEVVRYPPEGGEQVTSLPALHDVDTKPYGRPVLGQPLLVDSILNLRAM